MLFRSKAMQNFPGTAGYIEVFCAKDNIRYDFTLELPDTENKSIINYYKNIFNQMLSTFEFLEKSQDETADSDNYKKYNSEMFEFEVDYLESWTIEEDPSSSKREFDEKYQIWFNSPRLEHGYITIIIDLHDNPNNFSIDNWSKKYFEGAVTLYQPILEKSIEINNVDGLEFIVELYAKQKWIFLPYNGLVYIIKLAYPIEGQQQPYSKQASEIFDEFLSSFKFLE